MGLSFWRCRKFVCELRPPPSVSCQSWNLNKKRINAAFSQQEAAKSKKIIAEKIQKTKGRDVTVSCDGTWRKRGFSSKNGVVIVVTVNRLSSKLLTMRHWPTIAVIANGKSLKTVCGKRFWRDCRSHGRRRCSENFQKIRAELFSFLHWIFRRRGFESLKKLCDAELSIYPGKIFSSGSALATSKTEWGEN